MGKNASHHWNRTPRFCTTFIHSNVLTVDCDEFPIRVITPSADKERFHSSCRVPPALVDLSRNCSLGAGIARKDEDRCTFLAPAFKEARLR